MLIQTGIADVQVAEPSFFVRLAVPEILCHFPEILISGTGCRGFLFTRFYDEQLRHFLLKSLRGQRTAVLQLYEFIFYRTYFHTALPS